jgi:nucleoside-diphosphate-sugar epimerase
LKAHFVYASTAIVCGVRTENITRVSPVCPDTEYAKTKWLGEEIIAATGVSHCTLRIAGIFGLNGPEHLGLNRAIDGAVRGELPVMVGAGSARRNYVYVKDVAQSILHVLETRLSGQHLLAGSETLSVAEMLKIVCDNFLAGQPPEERVGLEASSQIVEPSNVLPAARGFRDAISDIHSDTTQICLLKK